MPIPRYVSAEEYSRQSGMGVEAVKKLCRNGELEHYMTEGGYYKIKVDGDSVSRKTYEELQKRCVEAETTLALLKSVLLEGVKNK